VPCFVLTHQPHEDFITTDHRAGPRETAASGKNVLAHSPGIAQQLLRAGLLDQIQLHLVPVLLGAGRRLFDHTGQTSGETDFRGIQRLTRRLSDLARAAGESPCGPTVVGRSHQMGGRWRPHEGDYDGRAG